MSSQPPPQAQLRETLIKSAFPERHPSVALPNRVPMFASEGESSVSP
jgi:hypothetical protein